MNAVIYARYSSHNQTEQSIEGQLRECHAFAEREGLTVVGEYIDRAFSGKTDSRPDFQRMIDDAAKHQFERVIVWKLDRFTRNRYDSAIYKQKLSKHGVKVVSAVENIGDNPEGIILESMLVALAEYYSEELRVKVKRGMRESILKGQYVGGPVPYGFRVVDQRFTVDPEQADIVRYCFAEYAAGTDSADILSELKRRGVRSSRGLVPGHSWLQTILGNRKYIGEHLYEDEIITDAFPTIVDRELFEKVQAIKARKRRTGGGHATAKHEYLMHGKLFCGYCGASMIGECGRSKAGVIYHYYACHNKKHKRTCKKLNEKQDFIEWYIVEQTMEYVLSPERLEFIADAIVAEYDKEFDSRQIQALQQKIALADGELDKLTTDYVNAPNPRLKERIQAKFEELDARKEDMEVDLAKLKTACGIRITKEQVVVWLKSFCAGDPMDIPTRRRIIDTFINSVYLFDQKLIIYYNIKDGKQVSYLEMASDLEELESLMDIDDIPQDSSVKRYAPPNC